MSFDLYKDSFDKNIFLKDIWPSNKEIEDAVLSHDKTQSILNNSKPKKIIVVPGKIINIVL